MEKEALLCERLEDGLVRCRLCSHRCRIPEGQYGFCGVRENIGGTLFTHAWGELAAAHIDPVEKKPLYHFLPGSSSFSIALAGCNFHCGFCQNWEISQVRPREGDSLEGEEITPEEVVKEALGADCRSISYTYTEPTIFFEYALATAKLARENSLANIFVTNGYLTAEALEMIRPYLDAANVDLKFFRDEPYRRICGARLEPVLESVRLMKQMGIWVEITTLVIPGENDSPREFSGIADFIAGVDPDIPWHVSRFHPDYKFSDIGATDEKAIEEACEIGRRHGLHFVYAGNVYGWGNDTRCPGCQKVLVKREGFAVMELNIKEGKCGFCHTAVAGRWTI